MDKHASNLILCLISLTIFGSTKLFENVDGFKTLKFLLSNKTDCNHERVMRIDYSIMKLSIFGANGRKFPEDFNELKDFCAETTGYMKEFDQFIQECVTYEIKNLAKVFIYSLKRVLKSYCGAKKRSNQKLMKLLEFAPCVNTMVKTNECLPRMLNKTRQLAAFKIENEKIKYTCCNYVDASRCLEDSLNGSPCITEEGKNYAMELMRSIFNDLVNFACGEFNEETDRCVHLPQPDLNKFDYNDLPDKQIQSFFFLFIYLAESMENFSLTP